MKLEFWLMLGLLGAVVLAWLGGLAAEALRELGRILEDAEGDEW